ncbi:hypothetical protein ACM16X_04930 [Haloarcula japonica]|uniref:hypothetical protein n=1 Tax=Haloarcula japonica TaxID=29282 RepID=UPI0039F6C38B
MNGYYCPVGGCDFGKHEEKEQNQVIRHINAKSGDDHADLDRLREQIEEQGEEDEGNEDLGGGNPEQDEPDDEGSDATENDPEEGSEMPTDEEYQQQYDGQQDEDEQDGDRDDDGGESTSLLPALDRRTMMMLVGVLGVLVVLYVVMNRRGDETVEMDAADTDDQGDDSDGGGEVTLIE